MRPEATRQKLDHREALCALIGQVWADSEHSIEQRLCHVLQEALAQYDAYVEAFWQRTESRDR